MTSWQFLTALTATIISVANLSYLAWKTHNRATPRTLSELAVTSSEALSYFRWVLAICGSLFGISILASLSEFRHPILVACAAIAMVSCNMFLAIFPARGKRELFLHNLFAVLMALGMILLAYLFIFEVQGIQRSIAIAIAVAMSASGTLANLNRSKYIYFELPYLFLSHISILVVLV
jgi:hypothetical protein